MLQCLSRQKIIHSYGRVGLFKAGEQELLHSWVARVQKDKEVVLLHTVHKDILISDASTLFLPPLTPPPTLYLRMRQSAHK